MTTPEDGSDLTQTEAMGIYQGPGEDKSLLKKA
jgi:hypothetical protein